MITNYHQRYFKQLFKDYHKEQQESNTILEMLQEYETNTNLPSILPLNLITYFLTEDQENMFLLSKAKLERIMTNWYEDIDETFLAHKLVITRDLSLLIGTPAIGDITSIIDYLKMSAENRNEVRFITNSDWILYDSKHDTLFLDERVLFQSEFKYKDNDFALLAFVKLFQNIHKDFATKILNKETLFLDTLGIDFIKMYRDDEIEKLYENLEKGYTDRMRRRKNSVEHDISNLEQEIRRLYQELHKAKMEVLYATENSIKDKLKPFFKQLDINPNIANWEIRHQNIVIKTKPMYITMFDEDFFKRALKSSDKFSSNFTNEQLEKAIDGEYKMGIGAYKIVLSNHLDGSRRSITHSVTQSLRSFYNVHVSINCQGNFANQFKRAGEDLNFNAYLQTMFQFIQTATIPDSAGSDTVKYYIYLVDKDGNLVGNHNMYKGFKTEKELLENNKRR